MFAHLGEFHGQLMRELDRQRHEFIRLPTGIAKHQSLVAGPDLATLVGDPLADIR